METIILDYIPEALLKYHDDIVAPGFKEIQELSIIDKVNLRVLIVKKSKHISACAVCYIDKRRHHGINISAYSLYGYHLHDYARLYCEDIESMKDLQRLAKQDAKLMGCDLIYWDNIISECVPENSLNEKIEIKIFKASEFQDGWKHLYDRKSVKQSKRMAERNGPYRVEIIDGLVPKSLMEELKQFHISRWRFAGSNSFFLAIKNRVEEYMVHPENKHYLRIFVGDDVIACHYGMKYGNTLLFHTPIINPKFLKESPMRILLAETAKYCEASGLTEIDFGLGDEAYKNGYCTLPRRTCSFVKPLSIKGIISLLIGVVVNSQVFMVLKRKLSLLNKFVPRREPSYICFKRNSNSVQRCDVSDNNYVFQSIGTWHLYYDFCNQYNIISNTDEYKRFLHNPNCRYYAVTQGGELICSTWATLQNGDNNNSETASTVKVRLHDTYNSNKDNLASSFVFLMKNIQKRYDTDEYEVRESDVLYKIVQGIGFRKSSNQ